MDVLHRPAARVARPWYAWPAIVIEVITGLAAIPVGWSLVTDPTGAGVGLPADWIGRTAFATYLVPGLYLLLANGVGMLIAAGLGVMGHRWAPWATGGLGAGLIVWIAVQLLVMPETSVLQWLFLAAGIALCAIAVAWLRRTGWEA
jgi:hypothetical protein